MTKDVRKEQLALLRFEKQVAGLAAGLAALSVAAKAGDGKLHATIGEQSIADAQAAIMNLAQITANAHDTLNVQAAELGARLLEVGGGGTPNKKSVASVVSSIFGLG